MDFHPAPDGIPSAPGGGDPPSLAYCASEDAWILRGFDVTAKMTGDPKSGLDIYEFTSHHAGKGNGERAIRWLKAQVAALGVNDPGHPDTSPAAFGFWSHLTEKGLIDHMVDEEGRTLYEGGRWISSTASIL